MTDELRLDPALTRTGARNLSAAGARFAEARAGAGAEIAAATTAQPWGRDEFGQSFERGYRPIEHETLRAWERLAAYLQDLGDAAAAAVRDSLATDQTASVRIEHSSRNLE
jgi:hypothetical protein